jgi:hypothetical protein
LRRYFPLIYSGYQKPPSPSNNSFAPVADERRLRRLVIAVGFLIMAELKAVFTVGDA